MTMLPHDVSDVLLAPVVLQIDARLEGFGTLTPVALRQEIALTANLADWTKSQRESALLRSLEHLQHLHGWTLSLEARGLRLSHATHTLVLGLPPVVREYLEAD